MIVLHIKHSLSCNVCVQPQYFQDDVYCDTRKVWEAALSAGEWLQGRNALQPCVSLRPKGMKLCKHEVSPVRFNYFTDGLFLNNREKVVRII